MPFLARLRLGVCLADDMGFPKAAGVDSHVYSRSNTSVLLGLFWPSSRTVIVKVLRSVESSICPAAENYD